MAVSIKIKNVMKKYEKNIVIHDLSAEIAGGELFTLLFPVHGHRLPGPLRCWLERLPETVIHQILSLQPPAGLQDRNHKGASFQHIHCRGSRP